MKILDALVPWLSIPAMPTRRWSESINRRHDLAVEVLLVITYAGEEYVSTRLLLRGSAPRERELGLHTARTGYAMRRALDLQTDARVKPSPRCSSMPAPDISSRSQYGRGISCASSAAE